MFTISCFPPLPGFSGGEEWAEQERTDLRGEREKRQWRIVVRQLCGGKKDMIGVTGGLLQWVLGSQKGEEQFLEA